MKIISMEGFAVLGKPSLRSRRKRGRGRGRGRGAGEKWGSAS